MTTYIRNVEMPLFDQLVQNPFVARIKKLLLECEHRFPNDTQNPGLRELLFALDHHPYWPCEDAVQMCCQNVWSVIEDDCKWNVTEFIQKHIVARLQPLISPFESLLCLAQLLQMLIPDKTHCQVPLCPCRGETFVASVSKTRPVLVATDFDGTFGGKVDPLPPSEPTLCISERTWSEFTKDIKNLTQRMPLYIRGTGKQGDIHASATFKAAMIKQFGVTHFLEDDAQQIEIIQQLCPDIVICKTI